MKKCILSAFTGALAVLIAIAVIAVIRTSKVSLLDEYEHVDYVSSIAPNKCFVCGKAGNVHASPHWGEDNIGIVNLNTFDLFCLEINRYDEHGNLITEPAGVMSCGGLSDKKSQSYAHFFCFPDQAYARVQLSGVQYSIDRCSVQQHLCQTCLDAINNLWFTDQPPAEYAIVNFESRMIQPLLHTRPWFSVGNYGIDCDFKGEGKIDLLVHYFPSEY